MNEQRECVDPEIIDETNLPTPPANIYDPKWETGRYRLKVMTDLSKLFIVLSFALFAIISLLGLYDKEYAFRLLSLIFERIAYVFLVIFGSVLGKGVKE